MRNFTEQELVRRGKLEKFKELGIDPFGHKFDRTLYSTEVKEKYGLNVENIVTKVEQTMKSNTAISMQTEKSFFKKIKNLFK